jgi:hypothetical protein
MLPDHLSRLLTGFVDGQLSVQEQKQVIELLRRSAEAKALLQRLQADARLLGSMPRAQLPPEFTEQLQARLPKRLLKVGAQPSRPEWKLTWRQTGIFAAAATLLLAVGIAFLHDKPIEPKQGDGDNSTVAHQDNELKPKLPPDDLAAATPKEMALKTPGATLVRKGREGPTELLPLMPRLEADVLTARLPDTKPLREINLQAPLLLAMNTIDQDKNRKEIAEELALAPSWRLDFNCLESEAATNRLKRALQEQGIRLLVDPEASARQTLRQTTTKYAVLVENVTPQECLAMLGGLRQVDREEQSRFRNSNQFASVKFGRMTEKDSARLEALFGIKELKPAIIPPGATGKLIPVETNPRDRNMTPLEWAIAIWRGQNPHQGQGMAQPQGQGPAKGIARNAMLIADPVRSSHKPSNESQLFLNSRQPPRPGTLQIMIVLTARKG